MVNHDVVDDEPSEIVNSTEAPLQQLSVLLKSTGIFNGLKKYLFKKKVQLKYALL